MYRNIFVCMSIVILMLFAGSACSKLSQLLRLRKTPVPTSLEELSYGAEAELSPARLPPRSHVDGNDNNGPPPAPLRKTNLRYEGDMRGPYTLYIRMTIGSIDDLGEVDGAYYQ